MFFQHMYASVYKHTGTASTLALRDASWWGKPTSGNERIAAVGFPTHATMETLRTDQ